MVRTFIDAGLLIAAARGTDEVATAATAILDDPEREFASSVFVRLEVLPKALCYHREKEVAFYQAFFEAVSLWAEDLSEVVSRAEILGSTYGLSALDALHLAAAESVGATEFVTTEQVSKPLHRVSSLKVVSVHPF